MQCGGWLGGAWCVGTTVSGVDGDRGMGDQGVAGGRWDGAGLIQAIIGSAATGAFSNGTEAGVVASTCSFERFLCRSMRAAKNAGLDFPFDISVPAEMPCFGTVAGQ